MKQLIDIYEKYQKSTVALAEVPKDETNRFRTLANNEVEDNLTKSKHYGKVWKQKSSKPCGDGSLHLTPDIFDRIDETEYCIGGEIHLTAALLKLDSLYGAVFEGKSYHIENRLDWLKASIEFGQDDEEFMDNLVKYESYIWSADWSKSSRNMLAATVD